MMIKNSRNMIAGMALIGALLSSTQAEAALTSFNVDWTGADFFNTAEAHGVLTVDDTLFLNASADSFLLPGEAITAFSLTVSGAGADDGVFQLDDFAGFSWSTAGVPLDFTSELVGQIGFGGTAWGSVHDGSVGDFNLIILNSAAPAASLPFVISTSNDLSMNLVSFRPVTTVPIPSAIWLFGTGLAGLVVARKNR